MNSPLSQGYALLAFGYAGILAGVLYDLTRIPRLLIGSRIAVHVCDLILVAGVALITGAVFLLVTGGVPRPYGFVCMLAAALLEQWAIGKPICKRIVKRKRPL